MSTIWEDDFSSGDALAVSYTDIDSAETNATCGQDGGWGCRTTGDAENAYYGLFHYTPASPVASEYLRVTMDVDHAAAGDNGAGASLFEFWNAWDFLSLYHGVGDGVDRSVLQFYSPYDDLWPDPSASSAVGVITPGSWQTVQMEVWFSSRSEATWLPNADGRVKVSVDGVSVIDQDGLKISSVHGVGDGGGNETTLVRFGPMGNGDNIGIYTDEPVVATWVDIANFVEQEIVSTAFPDGRARVLCELWSAEAVVTMQARLYDATNGVAVGTSEEVTATTPTDRTFPVTLTTGVARYRLQITADVEETDLFCSPASVVI